MKAKVIPWDRSGISEEQIVSFTAEVYVCSTATSSIQAYVDFRSKNNKVYYDIKK